MASLEHLGAIAGGSTAQEIIQSMKGSPQNLIGLITQPGETPLLALFRFHNGATPMNGLCLPESKDGILRSVRDRLLNQPKPTDDEIIAAYFEEVALQMEIGVQVFPDLSDNQEKSWTEAFLLRRLCRKGPDGKYNIEDLGRLSVWLRDLGHMARADEILQEALSRTQAISDPDERAKVLDGLAFEGTPLSTTFASAAIAAALEMERSYDRVLRLERIADTYSCHGQDERAREVHDRAISEARELSDVKERAHALGLLAYSLCGYRDEEGVGLAQEAVDLTVTLPDPGEQVRLLLEIAKNYCERELWEYPEWVEATRGILNRAIDIANGISDPSAREKALWEIEHDATIRHMKKFGDL